MPSRSKSCPVTEANAPGPRPRLGQCQARRQGKSQLSQSPSASNTIQASYWLQEVPVTARECRDPRKCKLRQQAPSQMKSKSFCWVSATKSILLYLPPVAPPPPRGSFAATQNKVSCSRHRITIRESVVFIKK